MISDFSLKKKELKIILNHRKPNCCTLKSEEKKSFHVALMSVSVYEMSQVFILIHFL